MPRKNSAIIRLNYKAANCIWIKESNHSTVWPPVYHVVKSWKNADPTTKKRQRPNTAGLTGISDFLGSLLSGISLPSILRYMFDSNVVCLLFILRSIPPFLELEVPLGGGVFFDAVLS